MNPIAARFRYRLLIHLIFPALLSLGPLRGGPQSTDADPARGKTVFDGACLQCHDIESKERKNGPGLEGLKTGKLRNGREATHDRLLQIVNSGPGYMPAFKDYLSERQKEDLVAYMLALATPR